MAISEQRESSGITRTHEAAVQKLYTDRIALYHRLFIDVLRLGNALKTFFQQSNYLQPHSKNLDAGCGGGTLTRVMHDVAQEQGIQGNTFHAFDLTPAMLDRFENWVRERGIRNVELQQANVLELKGLPPHWREYDLIATSWMLEYVPRGDIQTALRNLKGLLRKSGTLLAFVTERTPLNRLLIEHCWKANTYRPEEIQRAFYEAEFRSVLIRPLNRWRHTIVVEATT